MSGIYIHIPYCKTKCTYCDFYSKTDFSQRKEFLTALLTEIHHREKYLTDSVSTIYFGGGTPSVLAVDEISMVLKTLFSTFKMDDDAEITLEANPDDLTPDYLSALRDAGINRLSMGVQSFDDNQLKAIHRRHTSDGALQTVEMAQHAGFDNISIDLIYGLPGQSYKSWKLQMDKAMTLNVQHLSAYGLIYEEGTPLWRQMKNGKIQPADDETMIAMYDYLVETAVRNGFEQYEIANFARAGFRSRHNSSYWKQQPYLGLGPAAHSYNGDSRQWNVSSITRYCQQIAMNEPYFEKEILTPQDKYNDFVMVSLRTMEGIDLQLLKSQFGDALYTFCVKSAEQYIKNNKLCINDRFIRLTPDGIMISDKIIVDLMRVEEGV